MNVQLYLDASLRGKIQIFHTTFHGFDDMGVRLVPSVYDNNERHDDYADDVTNKQHDIIGC